MSSPKVYLPGLNGLRALAASSVILAHVSERLVERGLLNTNYFGHFGGYAVTVFFTLSGFLITYLLLIELETKSAIDVKKFYMRRVLRIWPLYFFYIFLVLLVLKFQVSNTIWYYIFIIPNIPFALHLAGNSIVTIPILIHYWSLGVEEQFYAFWPWLLKYASKIKHAIILFCLLYFGLKIGLSLLKAPIVLQSVLLHTRFCCLGIGGFAACLYHEKNKILIFLQKRTIESLSWIIIVLFLMNKIRVFSIVNNEIISVFVVVLIINQISNPKPLISLENKLFDYMGKISFGLYIYNPLVIYFLSIYLLNDNTNVFLKSVLFIIFNFCIVIAVSHFSYFFFEKRFLNLKDKFITIQSSASKY